jgi:hypothetical protein
MKGNEEGGKIVTTGGTGPIGRPQGYPLDGRAAKEALKAKGVKFSIFQRNVPKLREMEAQLRAPIRAQPQGLTRAITMLSNQLGKFQDIDDNSMAHLYSFLQTPTGPTESRARGILSRALSMPNGPQKEATVDETVQALNHARGQFQNFAKQVKTSNKVAYWDIHNRLKKLDFKTPAFDQELVKCQRQMDQHMGAIFTSLRSNVGAALARQTPPGQQSTGISGNGSVFLKIMQQQFSSAQKQSLISFLAQIKFKKDPSRIAKYFYTQADRIPKPVKKEAARLILDKRRQQLRAAPEEYFKAEAARIKAAKETLKRDTQALKDKIAEHREFTAAMNESKLSQHATARIEADIDRIEEEIARAEIQVEKSSCELQMERLYFYNTNPQLFEDAVDAYFDERVESAAKNSPVDFAFVYDGATFVKQEIRALADKLGMDPDLALEGFDNGYGRALRDGQNQQRRQIAAQKPFVVNTKRAAARLKKELAKRTFILDDDYHVKGVEGALNGIITLNHLINESASDPTRAEETIAYRDKKAELVEYVVQLKADEYYADALLDKENKSWDPKALREGIYDRLRAELDSLMGGFLLGDSAGGKAQSILAARAIDLATKQHLASDIDDLNREIADLNTRAVPDRTKLELAQKALRDKTKQLQKLTRSTAKEELSIEDLEGLQHAFFQAGDTALARIKETLRTAEANQRAIPSEAPTISETMTIEQIMLSEPSRVGQFDQIIDQYRTMNRLKSERAEHPDNTFKKEGPETLEQGSRMHYSMFNIYGSLTISQLVKLFNPMLSEAEVKRDTKLLKDRFEQVLTGPALEEHAFDYTYKAPLEATFTAHTALPPPLTAMPVRLTRTECERITEAPKLFTATPSKKALALYPFIARFLDQTKTGNQASRQALLKTINEGLYRVSQLVAQIPPMNATKERSIALGIKRLIPDIFTQVMALESSTSKTRYHLLEEMGYVVESLFAQKVAALTKTDPDAAQNLAQLVQRSIKEATVEYLFANTIDESKALNKARPALITAILISRDPPASMRPSDIELRGAFSNGFLEQFKYQTNQEFPLKIMAQRLFAGDPARSIDDDFVLAQLRRDPDRMGKIQHRQRLMEQTLMFDGVDLPNDTAKTKKERTITEHIETIFENYDSDFGNKVRQLMQVAASDQDRQALQTDLINVRAGIVKQDFEFYNRLTGVNRPWTAEMEQSTRMIATLLSAPHLEKDQVWQLENYIRGRKKEYDDYYGVGSQEWTNELNRIETLIDTSPTGIGLLKECIWLKRDATFGEDSAEALAVNAKLNELERTHGADLKTYAKELNKLIKGLGERGDLTPAEKGQVLAAIGLPGLAIPLLERSTMEVANAIFGADSSAANAIDAKIHTLQTQYIGDLNRKLYMGELNELLSDLGTATDLTPVEQSQKLRSIGLWQEALALFLHSCIDDQATKDRVSDLVQAKQDEIADDSLFLDKANPLLDLFHSGPITDNAAFIAQVEAILNA